MKVLAMDPGGTTGWALIDDNILTHAGEVKDTEFYEWLRELSPVGIDALVIEDYKIRPEQLVGKYQHTWSSGQTLRFIGALVYWGVQHGVVTALQLPAIKPVASGLTGLPYVKGKRNQHSIDAALHGFFYLIHTHKVNPALLKTARKS